MDDFHSLSKEISKIDAEVDNIKQNSSELSQANSEQGKELDSLENRLSNLFTHIDEQMPVTQYDEYVVEINDLLFTDTVQKTNADKEFNLHKVDILVACIAGGLAVLVDFLIVKVPKGMNFNNSGTKYHHEGSSLTQL